MGNGIDSDSKKLFRIYWETNTGTTTIIHKLIISNHDIYIMINRLSDLDINKKSKLCN